MIDIQPAFNEKIPLPKLLVDFLTWSDKYEYGSLGYYEIEPNYLDDNWIENGRQLADQFALWLHLPEGSNIGFWRPTHFNDSDILPIVLIGSEGEVEVLGNSLEDFLYKWAEGADFDNLYDLSPDEEDEDTDFKHDDMIDWLEKNNIQRPTVQKTVTSEDLQQFFDKWQQQQ